MANNSLLNDLVFPSWTSESEKGIPREKTIRRPVRIGDSTIRITISPSIVRELVLRSMNGGYTQSLLRIGAVFSNNIGESSSPGIDCDRARVIRAFRSCVFNDEQKCATILRLAFEKSICIYS